jgi:hypothetical protein
VSPVKYELGFYIPEDDILHSHRRENLKCYEGCFVVIVTFLSSPCDISLVFLFLIRRQAERKV